MKSWKQQMYMSRNAPKAAVAMVSGVDDPTQLGIRDRLSASKELLDRVGLIKTEKVQVEASGGVMILPPKKTMDRSLGKWKLPQPTDLKDEEQKEWIQIPRIA